jgi:hypothetical protein
MANKFVVSVADAYIYDKCAGGYTSPWTLGTRTLATDTAFMVAKTLTDSSIETTVSSQDTRGGFGNQLLNIYYHSAEMNVNLTDAKLNLMAVKALVGDSTFVESGAGNNVITISADFVPKSVEIFLVVKIAGENSTGCNGIIGSLLIHIPTASLDGAVSIAMTADGVANTPFKARALASGTPAHYAKIYEYGVTTINSTTIVFAARA